MPLRGIVLCLYMHMLRLLIEYMVVVGGGGLLLIVFIIRIKRWAQDVKDSQRVTYQLIFPRDLSPDTAGLVFESLRGMFRHPHQPNFMAETSVVFEIFSRSEDIVYLVSFSPQDEHTIKAAIKGVIPTIAFRQSHPRHYGSWNFGIELDAVRLNLNPRLKLIEGILNGMREVREKEAISVQCVIAASPQYSEDGDPLYYVLIRVGFRAPSDIRAKELMKTVTDLYASLAIYIDRLMPESQLYQINARTTPTHQRIRFIKKVPQLLPRYPAEISTKALAVACVLPIGSPQVRGLELGGRRVMAADHNVPTSGFAIGVSDVPGDERTLYVSPPDLALHTDIGGRSGKGKSMLMGNEFVAAIKQGYGGALIDPRGDLAEWMLSKIPKHRIDDVILFEPGDPGFAIPFNIFKGTVRPETVADQVMEIFKNIYRDDKGVYTSNYLRPAIQALAAVEGMTLADIPTFLTEPAFRTKVTSQLTDLYIKDHWARFEAIGKQSERNALVQPALHRLGPLLMRESVRRALGQSENRLDMAKIIRENKILLVSLPEEGPRSTGRETADLIGSLVVTRLWTAATGIPLPERNLFFLSIDECQRFLNLPRSLDDVLFEARKFKLCLTLAHPSIIKLPPQMQVGLSEGTQNKFVFGYGAKDARLAAPDIGVTPEDIMGLQHREFIARVMNDGNMSAPFTGKTLDEAPKTSNPDGVRLRSQHTWGNPVGQVDKDIVKRQNGNGMGGGPLKFGREDDPEDLS